MTIDRLVARHGHVELTPAEAADIKRDPYDEMPKYAKAVVGFNCGVIAIAGLFNLLSLLLRKTAFGARVRRGRLYRRSVAAYRWIETSQPKAVAGLSFPTWGTIGLIGVFWAFVLVWSLAVQPYYRSRWNVGSPPLALRTGLFALGCYPFIFAFGAKWNIVGFIVGASHEKLQVYHQWLSHLFLILSMLHTFPFVVQGMREVRPNVDGKNPRGLSQIAYAWQVDHKVYYWSGTAALICLAWLCWGSFSGIRKRSYELFKLLHIAAAIIFSWAFYLHCNKLLGSWDWIWSTAIIYLTSVFMRFGLMFIRNGHSIPLGHIERLANNAVRVVVRYPAGGAFRWQAGQHVFVNFIRVRPFESHPYTISNVAFTDAIDHVLQTKTEQGDLHLVFRIDPKKGLGPRLLSLAESANPSTPVLLDGPYGGPSEANRDLGRHDTVLLLAGGAGMTFAMAMLESLTERLLRGDASLNVSHLVIHWAVRNGEAETWFTDRVERCALALRKLRGFTLDLNLYITDDESPGIVCLTDSASSTAAGSEKGKDGDVSEKSVVLGHGTGRAGFTAFRYRPSFPDMLNETFASVAPGSTVGIGSCGPVSLTTDVRRAVGAYQWQLAKGHVGETVGAAEVELVTEVFDW